MPIPTNGRRYKIYSAKSDLPIAIKGGTTTAGTEVIQWIDENADHFKWAFEDVGQGHFKIYSVKSGLPIAIKGGVTTAGAEVIQWTDENTDHFKWRFVEVS